MIPYYINEAMLQLPKVARLHDMTRQFLEVVTEDGAELDLVIARVQATPGQNLRAAVEADLADRRRSLRGFELLSIEQRERAGLPGVEVRLRFVDKGRGPLFHHEFHSIVDGQRIGFHGISKGEHAAACDAWMVQMLESLRLRR